MPRSATTEISWWYGKDGNLLSVMTFDKPTTVKLAIRAWSELL